ncbi:MAG TPA: hypothetical protein ENI85_05090 [Deltaproteobacteria bacterium]|nr:hypothetical protein [Deltaproteobacteria bacterium]
MKIECPRIQAFLIGSLLLATLPFATPAWAGCDSSGAAGTGLQGAEMPGTGTGGTGLRDSGLPGSGTGTGGTGFSGGDGTGTGGTGIFGLVTGFGSVCVNGLEVEYDSGTRIRRDGEAASVSDLSVGQTVRILTSKDRPLFASRIDVETAVSGPVDRVDPASRRVWVMDQPVELRPGGIVFDRATGKPTTLDRLEAGAHLSVSGLRRADGIVAASRLDREPRTERASVTAVVREMSRDTVYVGDVRSTLPSLSDSGPAGIRDGRRVRVHGRWNAETRTLEATRIEGAPVIDPRARRVSIQGFAAPGGSDTGFRLAGTGLEIERSAARVHDLNVDALVRVEGHLDQRGRVRAERIFVDTPGRHGHPLYSRDDEGHHGKGKDDHEDRSEHSGRRDRDDRGARDRGDRDRPDRPERSGRRSGRSGR